MGQAAARPRGGGGCAHRQKPALKGLQAAEVGSVLPVGGSRGPGALDSFGPHSRPGGDNIGDVSPGDAGRERRVPQRRADQVCQPL